MHRRGFLKNTIITSAGMLFIPMLPEAVADVLSQNHGPVTLDELERNFVNPPDSARPWVFYMWMNGNITKEGITLDLEAMKRMGIGGVINFNSAVGIPRGAVDYGSDAWIEATVHAITESERLGIIFSLHNSPGYSGCGGPWVTPEMSMQQLVWTEALLSGGKKATVVLPQPYAKHNYYQDAMVVAYPSVEKYLMKDKLMKVSVNGAGIDKNLLTDGNPETRLRLDASNKLLIVDGHDPHFAIDREEADQLLSKENLSVVFEFSEAFESRSISILRKAEVPHDLFDGDRDHPPVFKIETSDDGLNYTFISNINCSQLREMDAPSSVSYKAVSAKYYRLTANVPTWLSDVQIHNGPRLAGWQGKTNNTKASSDGVTPGVSQDLLIDPEKVLDISSFMQKDGTLNWKVPKGKWTVIRIGHTTTGEEPAAHPDAGKGLEIDKFRKEALDLHFSAFLDKLIDKVKPNIGKSFKGITVDSYEAGKQNWSVNFPSDFKASRNYDIIQWMPALTGRIVKSIEDSERFLWDVRKVQADLLSENFYGYYADCCHKRGLEFYAEPYGDGNLDSLKIGQHVDVPMSEFWTRWMYGNEMTSKQAVSIAHTYGKKVVAAEAYTTMPENAKWTDYPYALKAEGDYFFTLGVNRLVFHTFVHQPYTVGLPGMTMGPFGMHINRNNTWSEQAYGWTNYLKRSQYLLQQGKAVGDICYFKGDEPESGVPDIYKFLPFGYAGDVIGQDALLNRIRIEKGGIVLPDGMSYKVFMMAPLAAIQLSSLKKIKALVEEGMILIAENKPQKALGNAEKDAEILALSKELYGNLDGINVKERVFGKGKIIWGKPLASALLDLSILPDFKFSAKKQDAVVHYLHKTIDNCDLYLISNGRRRPENIVVSLRLNGKQPEIWNAETGSRYKATVYNTVNGRTEIPLSIEPAGSLFIVFREAATLPAITAILKDGKEVLSVKGYPSANAVFYQDVQNNFSISFWAKPDNVARSGRSFVFHAPEGEKIYGKGHAAIAVSAGKNGVRVYERSAGNAREVLKTESPISGWTHFSVVYESARPSIYINGDPVATGKTSASIVHPGLNTLYSFEQHTSYFEGNNTQPELSQNVLSLTEIKALYNRGLPALENVESINITQYGGNSLSALIWENGKYTLKTEKSIREIGRISGCSEKKINGSWKVRFPENTGAPTEITLPKLISLKDHADFNVKHFSGTATYINTVVVAKEDLLPGKVVFLDLGRVEVIAEVKINDTVIKNLWKEPFRAEITDALKPGSNLLEIKVTNLWYNRQVGDEHLPVENEYSKHKFIKKLPDWYVNNKPKSGERITFTVWKNFQKTDPLLESGLLGPVKLVTAIAKNL